MLYGLEAANVYEQGPTVEETARVIALNGGAMKLRPRHPLAWVDLALSLWPHCLFLLRRQEDGRIDPFRQVAELELLLEYITEHGGGCVYLLDNEPNHADSPYRALGIEQYRADLADLVLNVSTHYPDLPLAAPPMAVMQDDLFWLSQLEPSLQQWGLEYRAAHLYWQGDNYLAPDWGRRLAQYSQISPGARWLVDELGDSTPGKGEGQKAASILDVLTWLRGRGDVEATTLFIAGGTPEWASYWLAPAQLARIHQSLEDGMVDGNKKQILASLDDIWGVLNALDVAAEQAKTEAARIRAQVIAIKQAAGLDSPKVG